MLSRIISIQADWLRAPGVALLLVATFVAIGAEKAPSP